MKSRVLPVACLISLLLSNALSHTQAGPDSVTAGSFSEGLTRGGSPAGWKVKHLAGKNRFSVIAEGSSRALKVESSQSATGLLKRVELDPGLYPVVSWRWKVDHIIANASERDKKGDDYAARFFVIFNDELPGASRMSKLRHKLATAVSSAVPPGVAICYVWANNLDKGEVIESPYTDWVRIVAVESGAARAGQWVSEERNVFEDFKQMFGREPKRVLGIALMTDTDNTKQAATAYYGDVVFKTKK